MLRRRTCLERCVAGRGGADALLFKASQVGALPRTVVLIVATIQGEVCAFDYLLDGVVHFAEKRVRLIEHRVRERPADSRAKLTGGLVSDESQALHGALDAYPRRLANQVGAGEKIRNNAEGDASSRGDVFHADYPRGPLAQAKVVGRQCSVLFYRALRL